MNYSIFEAIDRHGNINLFKYNYHVEVLNEKEKWSFIVIPENEIFDDFFFMAANQIDDTTLKITAVNRHNQVMYSAMGIPERIIQEIRLLSGKNVISSTNRDEFKFFSEEFRTEPATKVWRRLVMQGAATYNEETDIYKLN